MEAPAICNGCGNESPTWDQLCNDCSKEVRCQNCNGIYKRGQGLQEVNLCSVCLQEVFSKDEEEFFSPKKCLSPLDPCEENGFDHQWELYER